MDRETENTIRGLYPRLNEAQIRLIDLNAWYAHSGGQEEVNERAKELAAFADGILERG